MLRAWSVVLATVLCLATTQFAVEVSAIEAATSLKLRANPHVDPRITKRDLMTRDYLPTSFRTDNTSVFGFFVDVLVGTPPQFFSLAFSSSSTTWLPTSNLTADEYCEKRPNNDKFWACFYKDFFLPKRSSTFLSKAGKLDNYYGDGLFAKGTWGSDVFKINQLTISNVSFGLASNWTNAAELGLGVELNRRVSPYPSLPEIMAEQRKINSILYSIYLNDVEHDGGELVFGAVDEGKYDGTLRIFDSNKVGQLPINGVYWIEPDGTNNSLTTTNLQTSPDIGELQLGTPSLWVPNTIFKAIIDRLPALTYGTSYNAYTVDCNVQDSDLGTLEFDIDGTIISINARQMLIEYPPGSNNCVLTVYNNDKSSTTSPDFLLGSPFLRSAYTVWDFTNNQTSIANSIQNSQRTSIREVPNGGVIDLRETRVAASDTPSATSSLPTSTDSESGEPMPQSGGGTNTGAIAGGAVGGIAALALIGFLAWFFIWKRKRPALFPPPEAPGAPSARDGIAPDSHEQFMTQTYNTPGTGNGQNAYGATQSPFPPTAYQENWGSNNHNGNHGTAGSQNYTSSPDLTSYNINGNPRQSGQYNHATEMPAYTYNY